jgi:uncharacterized membrane protein YqiK
MRATCADDLSKMGLELISFTIKEVRDRNEYIANMGRPDIEAEGTAAATRMQGEADAEIILKKGEAEAKAMNVKAKAYQEWNQAAVVDKLISSLPEVAAALDSRDRGSPGGSGGDIRQRFEALKKGGNTYGITGARRHTD